MNRHRVAVLLVALSFLSTAVTAHEVRTDRRNFRDGWPGFPLQFGISPLAGDEPSRTDDSDLEPLRHMIGDATVAAFGETYHTSAGFYRMKHRIFRFLVEEMGFRAFAIESLWEGAERADRYVATCEGTARTAISEHINVWQSTEYEDLVHWMCDWNRLHPDPAEKVVLFGFDIQQPRYDAIGLAAFLQRIGIPLSDPRSAGLWSCEGAEKRHPVGQIPQAVHDRCIASIDAIEEHVQSNRDEIVQQTSQREVTIAMLRTVGLRAWQNQVFTIHHDFHAGYNHRDAGMAYAFHTVRALKAPGARTMVWAANSHVAKTPLPRGERPVGSHLADALGDDYVSFALTAFNTEVDFPPRCGAVERTPGSVEDILRRFDHEAVLVDTSSPILRRREYVMGLDLVRPYRDYDGIIHLRHSPKMHPLVWPPCVR